MPKSAWVSLDELRAIVFHLEQIRYLASSIPENEYLIMIRCVDDSISNTHLEQELKQRFLEKALKYHSLLSRPTEDDFPEEFVLFVKARIKVLEQNQPAHEPDETAEYEQ